MTCFCRMWHSFSPGWPSPQPVDPIAVALLGRKAIGKPQNTQLVGGQLHLSRRLRTNIKQRGRPVQKGIQHDKKPRHILLVLFFFDPTSPIEPN